MSCNSLNKHIPQNYVRNNFKLNHVSMGAADSSTLLKIEKANTIFNGLKSRGYDNYPKDYSQYSSLLNSSNWNNLPRVKNNCSNTSNFSNCNQTVNNNIECNSESEEESDSESESLSNGSTDFPDFDKITQGNQLCITNLANGGTISYINPTTNFINEGNNLYYTNDRADARIQSTLSNGNITTIVANQIQAETIISTSDERLKDNIKKIRTKKFDKFKPVKYTFKDDKSQKQRYGFIAQELEKVSPELVYTNNNGIKGVNYQDIISLLVKEVQDLKLSILKIKKKNKI